MYQCITILFYSWESMEILYEMFSCFHHSFSFFAFPEKVAMFLHRIEDFSENWFIVSREKTPRITKAGSTDHKTIKIFESFRMYHLFDSIFIREDITIHNNWYPYMLFEIIYTSEISFTSKCLFISTTMN